MRSRFSLSFWKTNYYDCTGRNSLTVDLESNKLQYLFGFDVSIQDDCNTSDLSGDILWSGPVIYRLSKNFLLYFFLFYNQLKFVFCFVRLHRLQ